MASNNITIALFLTINLVFFGFTMAQAPAGSQAPICPRNSNQVQACVDGLTTNPIGGVLNVLTPNACCSLVAGLDAILASACICDALRLTVLNIVDVRLIVQVLRPCGMTPPAGFICA